MQKTCKICGRVFQVTDQDCVLYKKLEVPVSDICPEERHRRKMAFRNERFLYKRKCDLCMEEVISMFAPDASQTVYCSKCWWGDNWDPLSHGQNFDFKRPFFEQFAEFIKRVPKYTFYNFDHENSDYCNFACHNKDCYMLFGSWFSEKVMYSNTTLHCLEVNDSLYANKCKHSYELIDCENCYEVFHAQNCHSCSNSYFLFDCKNCQNCMFCWNLRSKRHHILNKPVSKEEFEKKASEFAGSHKKFKEAFKLYRDLVEKEAIHKFMEGEKNENSEGNYLYRCKNAYNVFYATGVEDVRHSLRTTKHQKDSMFINGNSGGELMYDSMNTDFSHRGKCCLNGEHNSDYAYCWDCFQCEYIFGCASLRHKKYCILNKQYSKEEYEKLLPRIIEHMKETGEWGEFFPMSLSPFGYNESVAQEYYPLTQEEAIKLGAKWRKENKEDFQPATIKLPDKEIPDSILDETLACDECGKNYRIIKQELDFYKKYKLPLPRKCFGCRHMNRMKLRAPYKTFNRQCTKCGKGLKSSYAPDRPEKVYCEACYLKEVY